MNNTQATAKAVRAIISLFLQKYLVRTVAIFTGLSLILFLGSILLVVEYSAWWLLASFPLAIWLFILSLLFLITRFVARSVLPRKLSVAERKEINSFNQEFSIKAAAAQGLRRSPTGLGLLVIYNYFKYGGKKNMQQIITEPVDQFSELKRSFEKIVELFN
ncbi:hypothetical protein KBC31_03100 [Candidatus Saccharibacteria bacterium]|jgi:hypothetical protein|nr:hypothetical protein [Candidatus Saccharibacteria bacterium]